MSGHCLDRLEALLEHRAEVSASADGRPAVRVDHLDPPRLIPVTAHLAPGLALYSDRPAAPDKFASCVELTAARGLRLIT